MLSDPEIVRRLRKRAQAGKGVRLMPATALLLAKALEAAIEAGRAASMRVMPAHDELTYAVELWSDDGTAVYETLVKASSFEYALAAFSVAKDKGDGKRRILLRQGIRVMRDSAR